MAEMLTRYRGPASAVGILLLSGLLFGLGIAGVWGLAASPFGPSPWWGLLTVVPGCALVAARDRRPLLALALGVVLFAVDVAWFGTVGMVLVLHELIYAATASLTPAGRRRMRWALAAFGAAIVVAVTSASGDLRVAVLATLLVAAFLGTPYWWATAVRRAEEVAELTVQRTADSERDAIRLERLRMASDLHDAIAGQLASVALRSEGALDREPDAERDRAALAAVREASIRGLEEMREMILLLRSGAEPATAADRLDRLPEIIASAGATIDVEVDTLPALPVVVEQAITRIVRESLLNADKHAAGGPIRLRIDATDSAVHVLVHSRGGASRGTTGAGWGTTAMRRRAEAIGGAFSAGPTSDGWSVSAVLPIEVPV